MGIGGVRVDTQNLVLELSAAPHGQAHAFHAQPAEHMSKRSLSCAGHEPAEHMSKRSLSCAEHEPAEYMSKRSLSCAEHAENGTADIAVVSSVDVGPEERAAATAAWDRQVGSRNGLVMWDCQVGMMTWAGDVGPPGGHDDMGWWGEWLMCVMMVELLV